MIKGKMVVVGTMNIDGQEATGCFIECTVDELRNNRADIYCDVEIRASKSSESAPSTSYNIQSVEICSDNICDYCKAVDCTEPPAGQHCFIGRKLHT